MRTNLTKTLDQLIFRKYLVNFLKFTKYLANVHKFTEYLAYSYHQKGVKHYRGSPTSTFTSKAPQVRLKMNDKKLSKFQFYFSGVLEAFSMLKK